MTPFRTAIHFNALASHKKLHPQKFVGLHKLLPFNKPYACYREISKKLSSSAKVFLMCRNEWHIKHHGKTSYSADRILSLLFQVAPIGSLLDVGCGHGDWLHVAHEHGALPLDIDHPEKYLWSASYRSISFKPLLRDLPEAIIGKAKALKREP